MGYKRLIRYQYYQILINKVNAGKNSQDTGKIFNFAEWAEQVKKENLITKPVELNMLRIAKIIMFGVYG